MKCILIIAILILCGCAPAADEPGVTGDTLPPIGPGTRKNTLLPPDTPQSVPALPIDTQIKRTPGAPQ